MMNIPKKTSPILPIVAPFPQKSANDSTDSDFNAETLTSMIIQSAFEDLIENLQRPDGNTFKNPKFGNIYENVGKDSSNTYDMKAYVFGLRNRFAWKLSDKKYAWKNGDSVVYIDSVAPRVGDEVTTIDSYLGTIISYDSATETITVNGTPYTRSVDDNVDANVIWTDSVGNSLTTILPVYDKQNNINESKATWVSDTSVLFGGVTYTRCESLDYHTDQKATIVLWANEHGPQSDPNEASIILYRLAKDLCYGGRDNKFLQFLARYCKVVLLPCANPYGVNKWVENKRDGRTNVNGVNINRNYDTKGWSLYSGEPKGNNAGDQNETQFIMNLVSFFDANIAIDVHCLGYVTQANEGRCHYSGKVSSINDRVTSTMLMYGLAYSSYGETSPNTSAKGSDWINKMGVSGGLIEMNAGSYASSYNGNQHSDIIMESDYTLLLNAIRMWYHDYDDSMDLMEINVR